MDSQIIDCRIVTLNSPMAIRHEIVGGKGANLGQLTNAGFLVPGGFVVTTAAYSEFLQAAGITDAIRASLETIDYDDLNDLETKTAKIRQLIEEAQLPGNIAEDVRGAYVQLGSHKYVAVRSSGTAEDLVGTSFAGLHDTYLDIIGHDSLLEAVKRCWASLWSARATKYREHNKFDHLAVC